MFTKFLDGITNNDEIYFSKMHKKLRSRKRRNWRQSSHKPLAVSDAREDTRLSSKSACRRAKSTSTRVIIKWQNKRLAVEVAEVWLNRSSRTRCQLARPFQRPSQFRFAKLQSFSLATSSLIQVPVNSSAIILIPKSHIRKQLKHEQGKFLCLSQQVSQVINVLKC